jgi:hypothetical protein
MMKDHLQRRTYTHLEEADDNPWGSTMFDDMHLDEVRKKKGQQCLRQKNIVQKQISNQ